MSKSLLFTLAFALASLTLSAQNFEVGLTLGLSSYNGDIDINARNFGSSLKPGIGILGKYRLSNNWLLRGQFLSTKLSASEKNHPDAWRQQRGFAFKSSLRELTVTAEYEFLQTGKWTAYAFGGVGVAFFNPKTDYNMPNPFITTDINTDANTNFKKITPAIPLGLGVKYQLPWWDLNLALESGYRKVFTDYLDGVSKLANPDSKDTYFFTGLTLTKAFGGGKNAANRGFKQGNSNCPKFD
jgi:OmpA-OmpF porin, OOP family